MVIGYKHRLWEVFISVSASGPEYSEVFEQQGRHMRPRMTADLRYTTSDVDYLFTYFTKPELDRKCKDDLHLRLVNPTRAGQQK